MSAPPSFGGQAPTGTTSGQTLYGLPSPDDADELTMLGDDSGPLGETTAQTSGPPSIGASESSGQFDPAGLFDSGRYGEVDLAMPSDDGLELDLPGLSTPDRAGVIGTRRDLPELVDDDDLPMPAADAITKADPRRPEPTVGVRPTASSVARPTTATPAARPTTNIPAAAVRPTTKIPAATPPSAVRPAATITNAVPPPPARPPSGARPAAAPPQRPSSVPPPAPPAAPRRPPPFTASSSSEDLPVPSRASGNDGFGTAADLPAPSRASSGGGFGSAPLDLPTPSRPGPAGPGFPRVSGPPPSPPAYGGPSGPMPRSIETPSAPPRGTARARSPSFDDSMISVADLDLPSPVELDLPGPTGVDLPGLVHNDMLTPASVDLLQPAALDVEPANILPAPAALDIEPARSDMQPAPGDVRPSRGSHVPVPRAIATNAAASTATGAAPSTAYDPLGARRSPTPRDVGGETNRRPFILALVGIGVLAALGGGLFLAGVFDPPIEDVQPQSLGKKNAPKEPVVPATLATERSADVLAAMAKHTPKAYVEAIALAEAAGDRVGQAEAALRLHVRYGPDAVRRGQAETWLEAYAAQPDPFVQRVVGLAALARNDLAKADATLVGDDASTRLYRGWLRIQQGRFLDAAVEADAVLGAAPGDVAALALRHEAKAEIDAASELVGIEASLAKHPAHPGLTLIAAKSAIAAGLLQKGRTWLDGLGKPEGTGQGYAARVYALRGALDEAAGAPGKAALRYAEALAFAPEDTTLAPSRVRALMKAKRIAEASSDAASIVKSRPGDVEALLLQAEVAIEGGEGDKALTMLDAIEKSSPGLARTSYLLGLVHAMRNEIADGKKAFATALERDPKLDIARIAEARMLADFGSLVEATTALDAARKLASERPGGAPKVQAEILRAKAAILKKVGQTAAALAALDDALVASMDDSDAQLARGLLRLESGQYAEGKADLLAVYERTGNYAGLTAPLGRIFVREGNMAELEKLVGDVLADPEATNEELIVGARLRLAQSKPDEAKVLAERVLAASANDWEAHLLMAQALVDTGAYPEALVEIEACIPPAPNAEKHLWRGKILEFNTRHGEAPAEYRKALALDPELHEARFLNGRLLARRGGEAKAAEEELAKVVAATDAFPRAFVELARAQKDLAQWDKARANLKIALSKDDKLYEAHYLLGSILEVEEGPAAAIPSLEKATVEAAENEQDFGEAIYLLGTIYEKQKNPKAARTAFERVIKLPTKHRRFDDATKRLKGL